jgi:hypothetical protein
VNYADEAGHELVGRRRSALLLLQAGLNCFPHHLGGGLSLAAGNTGDPLPCRFVEPDRYGGCHGTSLKNQDIVLRPVLQEGEGLLTTNGPIHGELFQQRRSG